jgi:hypothetical protein
MYSPPEVREEAQMKEKLRYGLLNLVRAHEIEEIPNRSLGGGPVATPWKSATCVANLVRRPIYLLPKRDDVSTGRVSWPGVLDRYHFTNLPSPSANGV